MSTNFVTAIGVSSNNSVAQCTDSVLHLLPCKIKCTCDNLDEDEQRRCTHPAKVDEYFSPIIRKLDKGEENNHCTASFRGRPLRGAVMNVPEGYQGVVLRENSGEIMEPNQQKRSFVMGNSFDSLYYWKLQNPPNPDEKLMQALAYTRVAHSIHTPIEPPEDVPQT